MQPLQTLLVAVSATLQVLVIFSLSRGQASRYPVFLGYSILQFLMTVVDVAATIDFGGYTLANRNYYLFSESIRQAGLYVLVISMIIQAIPTGRRRTSMTRMLIAGAILIWTVTILISRDANLNLWMTQADRNLSFCSAGLNLLLWSTLLASKQRDRTLLIISGGLGLQMTGNAIGQSLREIARATRNRDLVFSGNLIISLTHLMCLFLWFQAVRHRPALAAEPSVSKKTGKSWSSI